jgi:hypothetical protein
MLDMVREAGDDGNAEALDSTPVASGKHRRLLSSTRFQRPSGECPLISNLAATAWQYSTNSEHPELRSRAVIVKFHQIVFA